MPDDAFESELGGRVAGIDEAGRGPLAGPVVAAAVILPRPVPADLMPLLDDSKKLSAAERMAAFAALERLRRAGRVEIGVGAASVGVITRINILHASLLAMSRAVVRLGPAPDHALVDGDCPPSLACPIRCVIGGDALCLSIAAASIVAKVVRDRAMARLAVRWPGYGWETNAGYGTRAHCDALARLGPTAHHRPTFGAVRQLARAREAAAAASKLAVTPA